MIRFFDLANVSAQENVSYGIPYVNTDFSNVLQDEHLKAYGSYLEGINYGSTSSSEPRNNGIILSGLEILGTTSNDYDIGLTNSVIYLNGEFYEKDPNNLTVKLTFLNATSYYFYAAATVSEIRLLKDGVSTCTGSQTRYFDYSTSAPTSPAPYIKFQNVGTSRYFRRILKYFTSQVGDVYMTRDISKFNTGVGFNDMEGFVTLDSRNTGYQDIRNRFLRNAENLQTVNLIGGEFQVTLTPEESENHKHTTTGPYWSETWAPNTERASESEHIHFFNASPFFFEKTGPGSWTQNTNFNTPSIGLASGADKSSTEIPSVFNNKRDDFASNKTTSIFRYMPIKYFTLDLPEFQLTGKVSMFKRFTGGIWDYQNSELAKHRHVVPPHTTTSQPHENRPPYNVLALYTKKIKT